MQTKLNRAIKYRMYPTLEQVDLLNKTFGCVRFIWNQMLNDSAYFLSTTDVAFVPTPAKYKKDYPFLKEVDALALCNAQLNLKSAYRSYFSDPKKSFPNFKSKKHCRLRYTTNNVNNGILLSKGAIKLPKLGKVKIKKHRSPKNNWVLKGATIDCKNNKYYVSVLFEFEKDIKPAAAKNIIGLDYSSPHFYVDSFGFAADYPHFYRKAEAKLAIEQRKLSKMKRNSNHYKVQKRKVSKLQEHTANQRKDWIHKLSTEIANRYDVVCIEDLDLHAQAQSLRLGKAVSDNGFGMFRCLLEYKLLERGKYLSRVDKFFASTKTCHCCGYKNKNIALKDRIWTCPNCNTKHDRDINAAINIKNEGLRLLNIA